MVLTPPVTRAVVCRVSACPSCPLCGRVSLCAGRDSCDRMCRVCGVSRARSVRRYRANCYSRGRYRAWPYESRNRTSRPYVRLYPPAALIVVPTIRSAVRAGPGCESRTRTTRESCPGLGASRPGRLPWRLPAWGRLAVTTADDTTGLASRSPCYNCALWWAASAHYSIPTLRNFQASNSRE